MFVDVGDEGRSVRGKLAARENWWLFQKVLLSPLLWQHFPYLREESGGLLCQA